MPTSSVTYSGRRVASNAFVLAMRMLVMLLISLYTSRVVFQSLGVDDYGLYNVVGGIVGIVGFFMSALSNACQRYLNIGLGNADVAQTVRYFRLSFTIIVVVGFMMFLVGETGGLWYVTHKMTFPSERHDAVVWVYQFSLASAILSIIQVPFVAAIAAYERMKAYAYFSIFEAFAKLAIAYALLAATSDKLVLYGFLMLMVYVIILLMHIGYCKFCFSICRLRFLYDSHLLRDFSVFIGSNLYGCFAWSVSVEGTTLVLNHYFLPSVNASRGLALQVNNIVTRFTDSIITAAKPQIIQSYASGNVDYTTELIIRSTRLGLVFVMFITIPIFLETHFLLNLWVGTFPDSTVPYVRLALIDSVAYFLVCPLWIAANATGDIRRSQIYGRTYTLLALPLVWIVASRSANPVACVLPCVIMQFCYWGYCLYDIRRQFNLHLNLYVKRGLVVPLVVGLCAAVIGYSVHRCIEPSALSFFLTTATVIVAGLATMALLLDRVEKEFITKFMKHSTIFQR